MVRLFNDVVPGVLAALVGTTSLLACNARDTERTTEADVEATDELVEEQVEESKSGQAANQMARQHVAAPEGGVAKDPVADSRAQTVAPAPEAEPAPVALDLDIEPLTYRIARQPLTIRTEPKDSAPLRGRIPISEAFAVFAYVDGEGADPGCDGLGWGEVGGGYVCLDRTRKAGSTRPKELPKLRDRDLTPFYYAKVAPNTVAHLWSSPEAYLSGADPVKDLEPHHDYAFVNRRQVKGTIFLVDANRRVVPERDVRRFYPSTFEGVSLTDEPVPEGQLMAWTTAWPETPTRVAAKGDAELSEAREYHERLYVDPEPVNGFYHLADGTGWIADDHLRVFTTPPALEQDGVAGDLWIDIDLEQQILTVMKDKTPVFATLISSGFKGPTPRGVFRIRLKQAIGSMSSDAGADDPYNVEAVPHVQYFIGGIALHSAYWHNRFGHRMSHGCVNLSPKDAKTVFDVTGPHQQDGWLHTYETEADPGTTLRIRDGARVIKDKRQPVEAVYG